ncbi:MAG: DUF2442 domain-containing protein [Gemmatimonadota bacterium]|jgi:hypothetical protein|nr:DUF2442 domain-containing protein [Gemmatimonadota bacterium]
MTTTWINPHIPPDPRIRSVGVTEEEIIARLHDGRRISIPLAWSEKLAAATRDQRRNFQILDDGELIYWPEADEFLSAQGMLYGTKARIIRREP